MVHAQVKSEGDGFERQPWPKLELLPWKVVKAEKRLKYQSEDEHEISLTCECLQDPWKGQWAYLSINHHNYKTGNPNLVFDELGQPLSKWAQVLMAIKPDFDYKTDEADQELQDLVDGYFNGMVEPAKNPKYVKWLGFKPFSTGDTAKYVLGASDIKENVKPDYMDSKNLDSDIPFRRAFGRHQRYDELMF
jgi:hypothetical protein